MNNSNNAKQLNLFAGQNSGPANKFTPQMAAIELIMPYVLRGETLKQLKSSYLGSCNFKFSASIGGYANEKFISPDHIIVFEIENKEIEPKIFKLEKVYNFIVENN